MALSGRGERTAPRRQSKRQPVSQRDTYRYYTKSEVNARPVDTYTDPGGVSQRTQSLIKALDQGRGLLGDYAQFKQKQRQQAEKEGYELGKIGKDLPEDASDAKIKGYLQAEGEGAVFDFEQELQQYTQENWQQDPETFQQGINEIIEKYTAEKDTPFLKGFVPKAEKVENQYYKKYMNAHQEKVMNDGLNNLAKGFRHDLSSLVENEKFGPEKVRSMLSEYQKKGKQFGLSRDEVSKRLIALVGREAEKAGDPEMMEFAEVEDEQGIKLTDTKLRDEVRTWKKRAVDAKDAIEKAREDQQAKLRKKAKAQLQRNIVTMLHGVEDPSPEMLTQIKQDLLDKWSTPDGNKYGIALDARDLRTYLDTVNDLMDTSEFAEESDPHAVAALQNTIASMEGPQDFEQGVQMLSTMKSQLSGDDFTRLHQKLLGEREALENKEIQNFKSFHNRALGSFTPLIRQGSDTMFGDYMKDEIETQDEKRVNYALNKMQERVDRFREENGRTPTYEEYYKMQSDVKKEAFEAFEKVESSFGTGTGSGGSKSSGGGSGGGGGNKDKSASSEPTVKPQLSDQESSHYDYYYKGLPADKNYEARVEVSFPDAEDNQKEEESSGGNQKSQQQNTESKSNQKQPNKVPKPEGGDDLYDRLDSLSQ